MGSIIISIANFEILFTNFRSLYGQNFIQNLRLATVLKLLMLMLLIEMVVFHVANRACCGRLQQSAVVPRRPRKP